MEETKKKELGFSIGIFDVITEKIENKISQESDNYEKYGVGIYTDNFVIENFMSMPAKKAKERIEMVKKIKGVDFTFLVDTYDVNKIKQIIENAYIEHLNNNE